MGTDGRESHTPAYQTREPLFIKTICTFCQHHPWALGIPPAAAAFETIWSAGGLPEFPVDAVNSSACRGRFPPHPSTPLWQRRTSPLLPGLQLLHRKAQFPFSKRRKSKIGRKHKIIQKLVHVKNSLTLNFKVQKAPKICTLCKCVCCKLLVARSDLT